jgi:hypothetical protein
VVLCGCNGVAALIFRCDVGDRLREGPLMPPRILDRALALAERELRRLRDDGRARSLCLVVLSVHVGYSHGDRVRNGCRVRRSTVPAGVGDDYRSVAD